MSDTDQTQRGATEGGAEPSQSGIPSSAGKQRNKNKNKGGEGFLTGILLQSLKWIIIIFCGVVLMVTVVVVTVNRLNARAGIRDNRVVLSNDFTTEVPILDWYSELEEIRGSTADALNRTFIVVPHIGYDQEDRSIRDELSMRKIQIRELISFYFASRTADELRGVENRQRVKSDLTIQINRIMRSGKIRDVAFDAYQLLEF